jgi:hypothetical protein
MKDVWEASLHLSLAVICMVFVIWFHDRRHLHPLPGRYPRSSILNACLIIFTFINQTMTMNADISAYPCWLGLLTVEWLLPVTLFSVALRAWMLLGQSEITKHVRTSTALKQQHQRPGTARAAVTLVATDGDGARGGLHSLELPFFVRHRHWVRPLTLFKVTLALTITILGIWFVVTASIWPYGLAYSCPQEVIDSTPAAQQLGFFGTGLPFVYITIALVCLVLLARKLSAHKYDAFGILEELRSIAIGSFIVLILEVPHVIFNIWRNWTNLAVMGFELSIFIPTIVIPIVRSYQFQAAQRRQLSEFQHVKKVEDLLALQQGIGLFDRYCQTVSSPSPYPSVLTGILLSLIE